MTGVPVQARYVLAALATQKPWCSEEAKLPDRATLRQWRARGLLPEHGKDASGHALYVFSEVERVALRHAEALPVDTG